MNNKSNFVFNILLIIIYISITVATIITNNNNLLVFIFGYINCIILSINNIILFKNYNNLLIKSSIEYITVCYQQIEIKNLINENKKLKEELRKYEKKEN